MLHRVTTLLSTVVVAFLATNAINVMLPTDALAADGCLAKPTVIAPNGRHWYYQVNRVTHQKCWFLGAEKAIARNVVLERSFNLADSNQLTERATAVGCIAAPNGRAPLGKRWYYRTDNATGQRCWRLSAQVAKAQASKAQASEAEASEAEVTKIGYAIPARSPQPLKSVAPEIPTEILPQSIADAKASLEETVIEPLRPIETRPSPRRVAGEVINENLATSTFASRWIDLSDTARPSDLRKSPVSNSKSDQPVPAVSDDVTNSTKAGGPLFTAERPLDVTLIVFVVSLCGTLILFGLIGGFFLYEGSAPPVRPYPPPLRLPHIESAPDLIGTNRKRVLEFAGERDRSGFRPAALPFRRSTASFGRDDSSLAAKHRGAQMAHDVADGVE